MKKYLHWWNSNWVGGLYFPPHYGRTFSRTDLFLHWVFVTVDFSLHFIVPDSRWWFNIVRKLNGSLKLCSNEPIKFHKQIKCKQNLWMVHNLICSNSTVTSSSELSWSSTALWSSYCEIQVVCTNLVPRPCKWIIYDYVQHIVYVVYQVQWSVMIIILKWRGFLSISYILPRILWYRCTGAGHHQCRPEIWWLSL